MDEEPKLCLIVARARNRVIGRNGDLPWRLKDDLALFKRTTLGAPILMGRKTWQSLPKQPLPGRENLILSRDWTLSAPGARVYSAIGPALAVSRAIARRAEIAEVFVIGGEALYAHALPLAERMYITEVDAEPQGDAHFPDFDEGDWREHSREAFPAGDGNDHSFVFRRLDRVQS
ncbi:MAG: dihydrofolate reductase [Pseudomonadota bacterium]